MMNKKSKKDSKIGNKWSKKEMLIQVYNYLSKYQEYWWGRNLISGNKVYKEENNQNLRLF